MRTVRTVRTRLGVRVRSFGAEVCKRGTDKQRRGKYSEQRIKRYHGWHKSAANGGKFRRGLW